MVQVGSDTIRDMNEVDRGIMHSVAEKTGDDYISICRRRVHMGTVNEREKKLGLGDGRFSIDVYFLLVMYRNECFSLLRKGLHKNIMSNEK